MNTKIHLFTLLCVLGLASLRPAFAQTGDPAELNQLRTTHQQQILSATAPASTAYLTALETLRQQFTRGNKVAEALSVDNEIKRIKREPTTTAAAADPPELLARRADYQRTINRLQIQPLTAYLRALDPLKQQFRRAGNLEAVVALENEIKAADERLKAAKTGTSLTTPQPQIQIESVAYGDPKTKRTKDATAVVRSAFESGAATVTLSGKELGTGDPAPGTKKVAVITYTVNGKRREKTFPEHAVLDLKKELR